MTDAFHFCYMFCFQRCDASYECSNELHIAQETGKGRRPSEQMVCCPGSACRSQSNLQERHAFASSGADFAGTNGRTASAALGGGQARINDGEGSVGCTSIRADRACAIFLLQ